jgi:hypothetical protein
MEVFSCKLSHQLLGKYRRRVFHRFGQAKFDNGGSILSKSQLSLLPQLPQKMKLTSKVDKIDPK